MMSVRGEYPAYVVTVTPVGCARPGASAALAQGAVGKTSDRPAAAGHAEVSSGWFTVDLAPGPAR